GAAATDAVDRRGGVTLEDGTVFDERQLLGGLLDRVPVGVLRAALDVVDFVPRQGERNPKPDKGFALSQVRFNAVGGGLDVEQATGADGRGDRAPGLADSDRPPSCDMAFERPCRLQLDFFPGGLGDRCQVAVELVHQRVPFRLPIEREPFTAARAVADCGAVVAAAGAAGRGGGSSRKSTLGGKNNTPVTAVGKRRRRAGFRGGPPGKMWASI